MSSNVRVFARYPSKAEALAEVKHFFELLKVGDAVGAGACVAHKHKDWWPHQVRSLWEDLVADADLEDDKTWRDLGWLKKLSLAKHPVWTDDDSFYLTLKYRGVLTDVSAEFSIVKRGKGWVVRRDIIHVA